MASISSHQKKINIDLATRIDEKSAARTEQDINNLIKAASATPIKIKIDDSDFRKLELAISDVETVLRRLGRDLKLDTESMNGRSIKGFVGLRESIVETLNVLNRFNETLYVPQNSNRSWIKTDVDGFYELSIAIIGAAKDTQAFNDQLKHISKSGGLIGVLEKISKLLSEIGEKLDIKQVRLPEVIKEEADVAEAAVKELENSLIRLGEGRLKKNGNESVIKYFTEMTANAQKAAEQVLSGNYDIPTSGFNRFIKELGTAMNLPNEELNKLSINIDGVEHKLVEFWNAFIENARRVKSNGELEFPTLGVKFGREGAPDVQTLPILKEIDKLKEAKTVLADLNKEYKDATSYVKRDFNVGLDQASIDALKEAAQSIGSINASLGEGTVLGFKPEHEQVEAVTGAFNDLKGVVQEIANILRQTFGASSISSTGIEETTNQITGATWAYTRLTGVLQQVKKEETTTASAPAFGINQDQVNSIISSLSELLELIRQIQSALVGTEAEGPLQTLTTNIQALASSLQNFDIFKGGKSLNASQIQQVADVVLNKMKEFGSVAADDKQKVQELAEVATELTQATSGIQTVQYPPAIADQWTKNLYNTKTVEEEIISAQEKLNSSVTVGSGEIKKETAEAQRLFDILKSDVNHGATPFDLATKQGVIESIKRQADEYETATRKALELAEAERKIQEERLRIYAQKAFQKDTGVGLNQFDQITRSGVAEAISRMTLEYEQSTRKAVELAEANRRIAESEAATQAWITDLQAAGEGASLATQKVNELNAAMANADAGYGLEPVIQEFELEAQAIENAKQKLEEAKDALIQFKEAGGDVKSDQGKQLAANVKAAQKEYDKLTNVEKYHKDLLKEIAKEQQQAASASTKSANEQKRSADQVIKTLEKQIELAEIFMAKSVENGNVDLLGERYNDFVKKVHDLKKELNDLKNDVKIGNISSEGLEKAKNSASGLKVALAGMETAAKTAKQGLDKMADPQKIDTLIRRIETFKTVNEHLSSGTVARLDDILNTLRTSGELTDKELKKLVNDFANIGHQAAQAGEIGANWFDGWKKRLASLSQYLTTFVSFYRVVGYVRESFNIINELDYALVDLKKTTKMSNEELEEFYHNSANIGKQLGTTAKGIIDQAAAWSRLGYNTKEASTEMAQLSSKFAAISPGMDLDTATDGLVSTMKAFHIDVQDVEREIMDSINRIGNTMATSNEEVVDMLTRSSAAMNAANNTLAETIALESAAVQITRNAETTGTAFRTISMRIRGLDEETEQTMEDFDILQGKIADLTKTADKPGGISLFRDKEKTEYKSTYEVLKDISEIYHDLTDKNQAALLEALAGKRGGQVLAGILDDFSEVERAMGEIEDSAGSANDEMEIVSESITFKLNALKQTWVDFLTDVLNRETTGQFIDNLTKISEKLIALLEEHPGVALMEIATAFKIIGSVLKGSLISKSVTSLTQLINTLTGIKTGGVLGAFAAKTGVFGTTIGPIKEAADKYKEVADAAKQAGQATQVAGQMASYSTINGFRVATTGMTQMAAAEGSAAAGASGLGISLGALIPIVIGVVGLIYTAVKAWDYFNVTVKETEEQIQEISSKISSLESEISKIEDLDYRNEAQQIRLDLLNEELRIQKELLEVQTRRKIAEQSDNKFTDQFDKDNWNTYLTDYRTGRYNYTDPSEAYGNVYVNTFKEDAKSYQEASDALKNLSVQNQQYSKVLEDVSKSEDDLRKNRDEAFEQYAVLKEKMAEMSEALDYLRDQANPDYERIKIIEDIYESYEYEANQLKQVIDDTDKIFGTYDWSFTIESAFQHTEFKNLKDELVEIGKKGELSVDLVSEKISDLLPLLVKAGLVAEDVADEVYAYIMNLADPERSEREKFARNTAQGLKAHENYDRRLYSDSYFREQDQKEIQEYLDELYRSDPEAYKLVIGLDINTSTFDWPSLKQAWQDEIDNNKLQAKFEIPDFNKTEFSETMDEFENLQKLYNSFYEKTNGKGALKSPIDISEIDALREKWGGFDEFEHLEDLLSTTGSTAKDIQESFDKLATQYTNTKIAVDEITDANKALIASQMELDGITRNSADAFTDFYAGINKLKSMEANGDFALHDITGEFMSGMGEGGTVDLTLRPVIDASELEKYDWTPGEGIATLFSSTYSNEDETIAMNFTPILADENGNYIGALTPDALQAYAERVIAGGEDYWNLKIGATFEGEDAIDRAVDAANEIHELQESFYNSEDGFALSIFADEANLQAYAAQLGVATDALAAFIFEKQAVNLSQIDTSQDAADLYALALQGNATKDVLEALSKMMNMLGEKEQAVQDFIKTGEMSYLRKAQNLDSQIDEQMRLIQAAVDNKTAINPISVPVSPTADTKSAGGAGKDAGKAYVDSFNEELSKLKESYERGEMSLSEYLNAYKALIEKYFSDTEKYAEERAKALHDYMQELKGYYDSAISGVTTLIDHRISAVQKQKDAAIKAIQEEKEAALKAYDDQIKAIDKAIKEKNKQIKAIEKQKKELEKQKKPLQDEIDAIQKAAEERERNLKAQKDLYELERAQMQRTQFIYKNGQMVYQQDTDSIRNAKQEVDKDKEDARIAKLNKQIDAIQKQEDLLDEQIELIQEEIDALEEQKELLEEQKAEVEEFYNNLIEETTAAFDAILEQLEATKSKWEELAEIDKVASAWKDVGGIMEMLGFTVEDVLNDTPGAFEAFKDAYVATLSGLNGGNEQYLQGLSEVTGKTVEELKAMGDGVANISKDTQQPMADIADSVEKLGTNSSTASGHVSSLGSSVSTTTSNVNELNTSTKTANENLNATNKISLDAVKQQVDNLKDSAEKLRQELDGTNSGGKTIKDLLEDINQVTFTGIIENLSGLSQEVEKIAKSITEGLAKALEADTTAQEAAKKLGQRVVGDEKGTGLGAGVEQGSPSESAKRVAQSIPDGIKEILDQDTTAEDAAETLGKDTVKALGDSIEADLNAMQIDFSTIFGDTDFSLLAQQFNDLGLAIQTVADALGMGQDASVGGLFQAISDLNSIDLGVESGAGVIGQFNALKTAIDSVSSAIGSAGGGEGESGGFVGNTNAQVSAMQSAGGGSGSSLSSSIEGLKSTAETAIGTVVAEEGAEGDGTVIGDFGALTTSVSNATAAIGTTESEADAGDLIGSIASLNEKSQEYMVADSDAAGDDGIVPRFNKLNEVIAEAEDHVAGIEDGLKAIDELEEVECTIKINIETSGDMPTFSFRMTGSAMPWEGMNLESGEYIAKYATGTAYPHQYGTANVKGNWGVQQPGKSLVGELGQEVIIRDGRFWTVGDNGPEFVNLQKDDIVLNHLQTREILSKKNLIKPKGASGRAYANGTLPNGLTPLSLADPEQFARFMQLADALKTNTEDMRVDLSDLSIMARDIERSITNTTYNNSNRNANITFGDLNFTCTGITSADVLSEVGNALEKEFSGIALNAYKKAMAH